MRHTTGLKRLIDDCLRSFFLTAFMIGVFAASVSNVFGCGLGRGSRGSATSRVPSQSAQRATERAAQQFSPGGQQVDGSSGTATGALWGQQAGGPRGAAIGAGGLPPIPTATLSAPGQGRTYLERLEDERNAAVSRMDYRAADELDKEILREKQRVRDVHLNAQIAKSQADGDFYESFEKGAENVKFACMAANTILSAFATGPVIAVGVISGGVGGLLEGISEKLAEGASVGEALQKGVIKGGVSAGVNFVGGKLGEGPGAQGVAVSIATAGTDYVMGKALDRKSITGSNGMSNGHHSPHSPQGSTTTSTGHVVYY